MQSAKLRRSRKLEKVLDADKVVIDRRLSRMVTKERLRQLYWDEGYSIFDIAEMFGVKARQVNNLMRRWGIEFKRY